MKKRQFSFTGQCKLTLEYAEGSNRSQHVATDFRLDIGEGLDKKLYLNKDDLPTKEGIKPLTQCFVQGLVGNIHAAHKMGFWDSADHLRYIIAELEKGFANVATVHESTM